MNLDDLNITDLSATGSVLTLFNPANNKPTDIKITVCGMDSSKYKKANRDILKSKAAGDKRFEDNDFSVLFLAASMIIGWENIDDGKKKFKFSLDNAVKLLSERPWILTQVKSYIEDNTNFFLLSRPKD